MNNNILLQADSVTKTFGRRLIFKNVSFNFNQNGVYGIAGINGSGKSTLVKIIAGIISSTKGKIIHKINDEEIIYEKLHNYIGFVSPYLILYDEFSAEENLMFFAKIRGISYDKDKIEYLLNTFLIFDRKNDNVKTYSSGMKQRLKYIFALMHSPKFLILDEPTSNLDSSGKEIVYKIIEDESQNNIVVIASNEESDLILSRETIELHLFKNFKK